MGKNNSLQKNIVDFSYLMRNILRKLKIIFNFTKEYIELKIVKVWRETRISGEYSIMTSSR